jgi:tetratricopeptide (TPR) repeat protein
VKVQFHLVQRQADLHDQLKLTGIASRLSLVQVLVEPHQAAAVELSEWWEDLWRRGITSQVLLLKVPAGWGAPAVLDQLDQTVRSQDSPVALVLRIDGRKLPAGPGLQAEVLRDVLSGAGVRHRVAELLGLDRLAGGIQLGVGVGGLFVSGFAAGLGFVVAGMAAGAAGKVWDDSPAGQCGAVARAARSVAQVSASVPVVVMVDNADYLDPDLAVVMLENLAYRVDGRLLAVAAVDPDGALARRLASGDRDSLSGRVRTVHADPDMSYPSRAALAQELLPRLPGAVLRRIAQRTRTFADVFAVASADRLAEMRSGDDQASALAIADAIIDASLTRPAPTAKAVMVAWAGGSVHARQAGRALAVLGAGSTGDDPDIIRAGSLVRLADAATPRLAAPVTAMSAHVRQAMAAAVLDEAVSICANPAAPLVDQIVAARAAHRVRGDLTEQDRGPLIAVQHAMVLGLESVGDLAAAAAAAAEALRGCPAGEEHRQDREELAAAVLRLAHTAPAPHGDAFAGELIAEAVAAGAAVGLEARVWAAVNLLNMPDHRETALTLAEQVAADLDHHRDLGSTAVNWRLLLAFHAGRAGNLGITAPLLAPLLNSDDTELEDAARAVLRAVGGRMADVRLQIALLESELQAGPSDDDRLRLHHALAAAYESLGDYRHALDYAQRELPLRERLQGPDNPATLITRHEVANLTGECGDAAGALRLYTALLPDTERVLGPGHQFTLATRHNIAYWTGQSGDAAGALRQFTALLPDQERVLGAGHPETLLSRSSLAYLTGECGDAAGALRLFTALLPDMERVLGPGHPKTLIIRANIAYWTGQCGDAAGALRQFTALLPDQERVLGADHPDTLATRVNLAYRTGEAGDPAAARDLFAVLLPIIGRLLGPAHPRTVAASRELTRWTTEAERNAG